MEERKKISGRDEDANDKAAKGAKKVNPLLQLTYDCLPTVLCQHLGSFMCNTPSIFDPARMNYLHAQIS